MENNRDKKGLFLGIISVATLIVAIIGATFAYFTATVTANNEVNFTSYQFSATASVEKVEPSGDINDLIPVDAANVYTLASNTQNNSHGACKDANNYSACAIYKVTINNTGSQNLSLTGKLKTTNSSDYTNLKIQPATKSGTTYAADGDAMAISGTQDDETDNFSVTASGNTTDKTFTVNAGGVDTEFYFVIYLDNVSDDDQNEEMGQTYTGQLIFTSTDGGELKATITTGE